MAAKTMPDFEAELEDLARSCSDCPFSVEVIDIGYKGLPADVRKLMKTIRENIISRSEDPFNCEGYAAACVRPAYEPWRDSGQVQIVSSSNDIVAYCRCAGLPFRKSYVFGFYNPDIEGQNNYDLFFEWFEDDAENIRLGKRLSIQPETPKPLRAVLL